MFLLDGSDFKALRLLLRAVVNAITIRNLLYSRSHQDKTRQELYLYHTQKKKHLKPKK